MPSQQRGRKECSHDRPDGRDGKSDGVAANHPLAMLHELSAKRVPKRFRQCDQEESSKQRDRRFLIDAANRLSKRHGEPRDSHDGTGGQKNSSEPAVNLRIFCAQPAHELQRSKQHKKHGRQNVRESQSRVIREMSVQLHCRILRRTHRSRLQQHNRPPRSDREPDERQKNHRGPQESYERAIRIHALHCLLFFIRRQVSIYNAPQRQAFALTPGVHSICAI